MEETIVSFEVAVLAKEKGFNTPTLHYYFEYGVLIENELKETTGMDYGSEFTVEFSELTENWNDGWLTKKNGNRCFGCSKSNGYFETFSAPTQSLLQKWIREEHDTLIEVTPIDSLDYWSYNIICKDIMGGFFQIQTIEEEFKDYEGALEKGLQGALKLIKCKD